MSRGILNTLMAFSVLAVLACWLVQMQAPIAPGDASSTNTSIHSSADARVSNLDEPVRREAGALGANSGIGYRVEDSRGRPVSQASIACRALSTHRLDLNWSGVTDAQGVWDLSSIYYGGVLEAVVTKPGYQQQRRRDELNGQRMQVVVTLLHEYVITGRIVDKYGNPIVGAVVSCSGERKISGRNGGFVVSAYEIQGPMVLLVTADGFQKATVSFGIGGGAKVALGDIVIEAGRDIRGRVTDADTGAAIDGAVVMLWSDRPAPARTDARGVYRLTSAAQGRHSLMVNAAGYRPGRAEADIGLAGATVNVALSSGGRIEGYARDSSGTGISGALIRTYQVPRRMPASVVRTDASGWYVAAGHAPGRVTVEVLCDLGQGVRTARVAAFPLRFDLVIDALEPVAGRVVDVSGVGIEAAVIRNVTGKTVAATDGVGHFSVSTSDVMDGLWISKSGYAEQVVTRQGAASVTLKRRGELCGHVVRDDGGVVSDFTVRLYPSQLRGTQVAATGYAAQWQVPGVRFVGSGGSWVVNDVGLEEGSVIDIELLVPECKVFRIKSAVLGAWPSATHIPATVTVKRH